MDNKYFNTSLKIYNYTIGYSREGESILVIIKMDEIAIFTIVIDSYAYNQNVTYNLLKDQKIEHIDLLCWTHPDSDHSVGLEKLLEFVDCNTTIIVSDGFVETKEVWKNANPNVYNFIENELNKNLRCRDKVRVRKASLGMNIKSMLLVDARTGIEYPFKIDIFSPNDYQTLRRNIKEMELNNNFMSVGMIVKVGTVVSVYSSDVPDVIFNNVYDGEFPEIVDYIKIPHHCSKSSSAILKLIKNTPSVACTTVFVSNNLPNEELLKKYTDKVKNVYCTNNLAKKVQTKDYGIIMTKFNIIDTNDINTKVDGNAREYIIT